MKYSMLSNSDALQISSFWIRSTWSFTWFQTVQVFSGHPEDVMPIGNLVPFSATYSLALRVPRRKRNFQICSASIALCRSKGGSNINIIPPFYTTLHILLSCLLPCSILRWLCCKASCCHQLCRDVATMSRGRSVYSCNTGDLQHCDKNNGIADIPREDEDHGTGLEKIYS